MIVHGSYRDNPESVSLHSLKRDLAEVENVMCTNSISVSWNGWLYDCDFNQMLNLKVASKVKHIKDYNENLLTDREIVISQQYYGCTTGPEVVAWGRWLRFKF